MNTIWLNNSSLAPLLNCPRQYVYRTIYGLRYARDISLNIGLAFHHFMRVVEPGDNETMLLFVKPPDKPIADAVANLTMQKLATLAIRLHSELPQNDTVLREQFLSVNTSALLNPDVIKLPADTEVRDALTLDRTEVVTLGNNGPYLLLTDYKTTHKPVAHSDNHVMYSLSSQLRFYLTRLRYAAATGQLPAAFQPYAELITAGRIATRYIYINYTDKAVKPSDQIFICEPRTYTQDELDTFVSQVDDRRMLAAFLGLNPHLANKDGIMTGACFKCPYQSICLLGNPGLEQTAVQNWPLGRAPYDPTHQNS